jgi:type IV pilus assembly protein PilO
VNNLSRREKYLIVIIGVLAIIYVYYSFFLSPVINKIKIEKSTVDSYNVQLKNINGMKASNMKLINELDDLKEKNNKNSIALPNFEKNPEITYKLKTMADTNNVNISNVNMSQPITYSQSSSNTSNNSTNSSQQSNTNNSSNSNSVVVTAKLGSLLSIPVSITINGDYDGIMNFISSIEKDERLSIMNTVSLDSQSSNGITTIITLDYFYIAPSANDKVEYDFNKGDYGKDNPFK